MPTATSASSNGSAPATKSQYTSSPLLPPFLGPTFDPTAYLNAHLPNLAIPTPSQPVIAAGSLGVADHAARIQPQLATLAALAQQLAAALTTLTDDVLRSGARLAYAVELLRGEARALQDAMRENLQGDLAALMPGGVEALLNHLEKVGATNDDDGMEHKESKDETSEESSEDDSRSHQSTSKMSPANVAEPTALARLRTLHLVRSRLQQVITIFDAALAWPLPPSAQLSIGGLVSVAPPSDQESQTREDRGQAAHSALRERVMDALAIKGAQGLEKAETIVEELRELCGVWKGTAEEKPRLRFVEGLAKVVAERRREEEAKGNVVSAGDDSTEDTAKGRTETSTIATSGEQRRGGLFGGLRRLRDEIYLE